MTKQYLNYRNKLNQKLIKIIILIIVFYTTILITLYYYYHEKEKFKKNQLLETYYNKLIEITLNKISVVSQQLSNNNQSRNILNSNISDLEICNETGKCLYYNLFHFGSLLNDYIPEFIFYRIELNQKLLYSNVKIQRIKIPAYQLEKTYHLNEVTQINISLTVDEVVWSKRENEINTLLLILITFLGANIILLGFALHKSFNYFNKIYDLYYGDKHAQQLKQITKKHQQELDHCKTTLMKKIWDNDFSKQKDLEINYLFAQKANQIAFANDVVDVNEEQVKNKQFKKLNDKVPCSIVLYQANKIEEVNIELLISLFKSRFDQEDENISIKISSSVKTINFSSTAAFYQIIYSIISYLFFLLKKQPIDSVYSINLNIINTKDDLILNFKYDGYAIFSEKELLKISSDFFKTHANPFLLNPNQVFNILKNNGFNLTIDHDTYNTIELKQQKQQENNKIMKMKNNVILLTPFAKKTTTRDK